jgi:hypothetical protein
LPGSPTTDKVSRLRPKDFLSTYISIHNIYRPPCTQPTTPLPKTGAVLPNQPITPQSTIYPTYCTLTSPHPIPTSSCAVTHGPYSSAYSPSSLHPYPLPCSLLYLGLTRHLTLPYLFTVTIFLYTLSYLTLPLPILAFLSSYSVLTSPQAKVFE